MIALLVASTALVPADFRVESLPGLQTPPSFNHYAGYMPLGDDHGTSLFFWFCESQNDPATDPLVFWTNGGPGSSSVAYGFWTEHGPWRLERNSSGAVVPTPYQWSWNLKANVVYLEMPTGVGFSYSDDATHYRNITDATASADSYAFLVKFFETFSTFKANDFYVTGESYGGHYVPTLATRILDELPGSGINMKGFLIGNPGINSDWYYNVNEYAFDTFMWSHGLLPSPAYDRAKTVCGWDTFLSNCSKDFTHPSAECEAATAAALKYVPSPLDPYDVLAPTCQDKTGEADAAVGEYTPALHALRRKYDLDLEYDPCLSRLTAEYMNDAATLGAVHAQAHYTRRWPSHPKGWSYNEGVEGAKQDIALLFPRFFEEAPHWSIAVVSGTADAAVPFLGTERWMECLAQPMTKDWRAWYLHGDVAGMIKNWEPQLSLVTVKGCGHTIPTYCPEAGYAFFDNWLNGK